jgi:hypothetical protein
MKEGELCALAAGAMYVGSGQHKDVPMMGIVPSPRVGATTFEKAEDSRIDNPDCMLCPRKWAKKDIRDATHLLREAIRLGQVSRDAASDSLPSRVWVRDPQEPAIIYEAKRLSNPERGYKAYPLTTRQAKRLPLTVR